MHDDRCTPHDHLSNEWQTAHQGARSLSFATDAFGMELDTARYVLRAGKGSDTYITSRQPTLTGQDPLLHHVTESAAVAPDVAWNFSSRTRSCLLVILGACSAGQRAVLHVRFDDRGCASDGIHPSRRLQSAHSARPVRQREIGSNFLCRQQRFRDLL